MAGIIPQNKEQVRMNVSSPVPLASAESARGVGQAMQRFGNTMQDAGGVAAREYKRLDDMDRRTKVMEAEGELLSVKKLSLDAASKEAAEDGSDLQKKYQEKVQPAIDTVYKKFSSDPEGAQALRNSQIRLDAEYNTSIAMEAVSRKETAVVSRLDKISAEEANRVRENPNEEMVVAGLRKMNADLDELVSVNPGFKANAGKIGKAHAERLALHYIKGLENKGEHGKVLSQLSAHQTDSEMFTDVDPEQAQALGLIDSSQAQELKSKGLHHKMPTLTKRDKKVLPPGMAAVLSNMSPEKKDEFMDRARAKVQQQTELRMADLNAELSGFIGLAQRGVPIEDAQVAKLKGLVNSNNNMTLSAKARVMDKIDTEQALSSVLSLAAGLPPEQRVGLEEKLAHKIGLTSAAATKVDPRMGNAHMDFAVRENREAAKQRLRQGLEEMDTRLQKDAPTFKLQTDTEFETMYRGTLDNTPEGVEATRTYTEKLIAEQTRLGVSPQNIRALTKGDSQAIAQRFKAAPSSTEANMEMMQLQAKYGPKHFPQVMADLVKDNKDMADYQIAVYADPQTRGKLLDAVKNADAIETSFKNRDDASSQATNIKSVIKERMGPFSRAVMASAPDSGSLGFLNSFEKAMELQIKQGMEKGSTNPDKLAKEAYEDIIGSQYQVLSGPTGSVIAPKQLEFNGANGQVIARPLPEKRITGFLSAYSEPGSFSELGVAPPKSWSGDPLKFKNELLPRNHRWITNTSQSGLQLMYVTNQGRMEPVNNVYGKKVEVSYESLLMRPSPRTLSAEKGFRGQLTSTRSR